MLRGCSELCARVSCIARGILSPSTVFPKECPFGTEVLGTSPGWELQEQVPGAVPAAGLAAQPGPDVSQMLLTSCLASLHLAFYVLVCFGLQTK